MAGMGPPPKAAGARQRRNKASTHAVLQADPDAEVPELPEHPRLLDDGVTWHPMTEAWWTYVWLSPMASEFDDSDVHGLFVLAMLVDDFWTIRSARQRAELAAEIRLTGQRFGVSPLDRRRLQWQIAETEDKQARTSRRRNEAPPQPAPAAGGADDARAVLRAIK